MSTVGVPTHLTITLTTSQTALLVELEPSQLTVLYSGEGAVCLTVPIEGHGGAETPGFGVEIDDATSNTNDDTEPQAAKGMKT